MLRTLLATGLALSLATTAAHAQEGAPDMSKVTASEHWGKEADSILKHGKALLQIAEVNAIMAKAMKKFPGKIVSQKMGAQARTCGRGMVSAGQWLKKHAAKIKGTKNDKTFADFMQFMMSLPERTKAKIVAKGKEAATAMKEWGQEMIKHADMALGMYEKMAAGAPAAEKKEEKKE